MVDHSEGIRNILMASGYLGGYAPIGSINQVDASNKFFVHQGEELLSETHWTSEQYKITLQASSEANLHTLKNALLNTATDRPNGYIPTTTWAIKDYTRTADEVYTIVTAGTYDNFPIAAGETGANYYTFEYNFTGLTTIDSAYISSSQKYAIVFNFPLYFATYTAIRLGVYISDTTGNDDFTIHNILNNSGKYSNGYASGGEKISVGSNKTTINSTTDDVYNEFTITTLVDEILSEDATDTYIKLLMGCATDNGAIAAVISRMDTDGDIPSTQYPYIEYDLDTTATGYPYWIGFTPSHKPKQLGPNTWEMELNLTASYEVS